MCGISDAAIRDDVGHEENEAVPFATRDAGGPEGEGPPRG